jgi:hypothetical protein
MKYKFEKEKSDRSYLIKEDGHTMFAEDVIRRLNDNTLLLKRLKDLEDMIDAMRDIGVCEFLRMKSQGPAEVDDLWIAHLNLVQELDELLEIINK